MADNTGLQHGCKTKDSWQRNNTARAYRLRDFARQSLSGSLLHPLLSTTKKGRTRRVPRLSTFVFFLPSWWLTPFLTT